MKMKNITAPVFDNLIFQPKHTPEAVDENTKTLIHSLFKELEAVVSTGDDDLREVWFFAERGTIEDFGDYEEYLEDGEVENRKEFEELWFDYYPEPVVWYKQVTVRYKDFYTILLNNKVILQINPDSKAYSPDIYQLDRSELVNHLIDAVKGCIQTIRSGEYNQFISRHLPHAKRIGKILREDYWQIFPAHKEDYLKEISAAELAQFTEVIVKQTKESNVGHLPAMTSGKFFDCCRLGYEANQYEGIDSMSAVELYSRHADGRDEGLRELDQDSEEAFSDWFHDKERFGGHPWEVCRGGNSTHISLYIQHDEEGWSFALAGSSWSRSVETVKFYLALVNHNIPVRLRDGQELLAMVTGKDYIGIVPEDVFPRYCSTYFPGENIIDYMNLPHEERTLVIEKAVWFPMEEAKLM